MTTDLIVPVNVRNNNSVVFFVPTHTSDIISLINSRANLKKRCTYSLLIVRARIR